MITPRQINSINSAIGKGGLSEQDFKFTESPNKLQILFLKPGIYFTVIQRNKVPPVAVEAKSTRKVFHYRFSVEHAPSLLPVLAMPDQPLKQLATDWDNVLEKLGRWLAWIRNEFGPFDEPKNVPKRATNKTPSPLAQLHPAIQQAAGSRFASGHYSDAIQKACTALEKAVQAKANQPATVTGTSLMTTAFSKNSPLIQVATDPNEQFGFMNLYQGTVQALRNHYAHNLTELTDPARALEWLGFISALFYKLDEAAPAVAAPAP